MKSKLNEKGYALLMVMMLVLLFTVMGMGLLTMNINASKQFNVKEEQVQARHQAEMGVLHYQKRVQVYAAANQPLLNNEIDFCKNMLPLEVKGESEGKKYRTTLIKEKCSLENGQIVITVNSEGTAGQKGAKSIEAKMYMNNPSSVPLEPVPVIGETPLELKEIARRTIGCLINLDNCKISIDEFTKSEKLSIGIEETLFKNHAVVNNLEIGPGSAAGSMKQLIFEKDLYIKDTLKVSNIACIAVQGNFSMLGNGQYGNKTYIYVYGNMNLPKMPDFISNNGEIFVNGDVYINGVKTVTRPPWAKTFQEHPRTENGCKLPGKGNSNPNPWRLSDRIDAVYK